jgi:hypothetical protein
MQVICATRGVEMRTVKIRITEDRATLIDRLAEAMYKGDYNITFGDKKWEKVTKKEKSSNNFPYTKASKYMHRAERVVKFLEELGEKS